MQNCRYYCPSGGRNLREWDNDFIKAMELEEDDQAEEDDLEDAELMQAERHLTLAATRFDTCVQGKIKLFGWKWSGKCSEALKNSSVTAGLRWGEAPIPEPLI